MTFFNKNFWKFTGGFLAIVSAALLMLFGFGYWQSYQEQKDLEALQKELKSQYSQSASSTSDYLRD